MGKSTHKTGPEIINLYDYLQCTCIYGLHWGYLPLLQSPFLQTFGKICFQYGLKWRYEFNNSKSGVVTFSETKSIHSKLTHNNNNNNHNNNNNNNNMIRVKKAMLYSL